ncbi:MAG TPA: hypothetical protein VHT91_49095 [Kofleriaceae bacterium]|nr:hypothetical protein [Kofleriaceae bacterium]
MLRSRTSSCTSSLGCACAIAALFVACRQSSSAVAELAQADGPVERQEGSATWQQARIGTRYFLGDAARVTNGRARLSIIGATAQIAMRDGTVLRFGGKPGEIRISVEQGTADLSGNGSYALDGGKLKLANGTVAITASGSGRATVELTVGQGQVETTSGTFDLVLQQPREVGPEARPPIDAGVDAPAVAAIDAGVDAAEAQAAGGATIEVTGRRAELREPGQTTWKPLPAGTASVPHGGAVRLGPGTSARLSGGGMTLDLVSGARVKLDDGDALGFALEAGGAQVAANNPAALALPGGAIALAGAAGSAAEARLDATPRDTKVSIVRGGSRLTGEPGAELAMSRGETALLTRSGAIRVIEAIPGYFDFRVAAGESLTVHDPKPPTAVQFQFDGKCPDGGIIELDRDARFRTAKVSAGKEFANALIAAGAWAYRLRCTSKDTEGGAIASGRISVVRDDGRRPLPKAQGVNDIDADGRTYRISYQSAIPNVVVHVRNPGAAHRLHLASAGKEQTFDSTGAAITVPGGQLHEGNYTYWIDRDGAKQDKVSTLIIDFDQTAPQVYIESPINGEPWTGDIDVRGAVLPGWSAAVEEIAIPIDRQRRFSAKVGAPGGRALAIRLSHPQRGVHYYLRRPK